MSALAFLLLAAIVLFVFFTASRKERYGPVKDIKRIPFNDCKNICEGYYQKCVADNRLSDAGWCEAQFRRACVNECYYSNYHRM